MLLLLRTAVAGQLADVESLVSLKDLFNKMGSENLRLDTHTHQPPNGIADISSNFLFNSTINSVEDADWILLIGTNPRHEAAIINTRIRKAFLHYQVDIGILGHTSDLNYEFTHLGNSVTDIKNLKGDNAFYKKLATAKNPMVIIGSSIYERQDAGAVMADISKFVHKYKQKFVRDDWTGFNIMQRVFFALYLIMTLLISFHVSHSYLNICEYIYSTFTSLHLMLARMKLDLSQTHLHQKRLISCIY